DVLAVDGAGTAPQLAVDLGAADVAGETGVLAAVELDEAAVEVVGTKGLRQLHAGFRRRRQALVLHDRAERSVTGQGDITCALRGGHPPGVLVVDVAEHRAAAEL